MVDDIVKKVTETLQGNNTNPKVLDCLLNISQHNVGRQQMRFNARVYCNVDDFYCPLKIKEKGTFLPICDYKTYWVMLTYNRNK